VLNAHGQQFLTRVIPIFLFPRIPLVDFVLDVSGTNVTTPNALELKLIKCPLIFVINMKGNTVIIFLIPPIIEAPLNVENWTVLSMLLDVMKGVLRNVGNAKILMSVKLAKVKIRGLLFSHKKFSSIVFPAPRIATGLECVIFRSTPVSEFFFAPF
jgi:hypothetical protein